MKMEPHMALLTEVMVKTCGGTFEINIYGHRTSTSVKIMAEILKNTPKSSWNRQNRPIWTKIGGHKTLKTVDMLKTHRDTVEKSIFGHWTSTGVKIMAKNLENR